MRFSASARWASLIVVVLSAVQIVTSPGMIEPAQVRAAVGVQTLVALNNSVRNPDVVMHSIATEDSKDAAGAEPVLNAEESVLLSRSGVLIRQGNLQGARTMLARAASDGSTAARFALAETFDPFKLTAWGVDRVAADPAVAMRLYEQVLAAGDERAAGRIAALSQVR